MQQNVQRTMWFMSGLLAGLTALSISKASVFPAKNRVTDDTAIYQKLSEIRVKKSSQVDFDSGLQQLEYQEARYGEQLPRLVQVRAQNTARFKPHPQPSKSVRGSLSLRKTRS